MKFSPLLFFATALVLFQVTECRPIGENTQELIVATNGDSILGEALTQVSGSGNGTQRRRREVEEKRRLIAEQKRERRREQIERAVNEGERKERKNDRKAREQEERRERDRQRRERERQRREDRRNS